MLVFWPSTADARSRGSCHQYTQAGDSHALAHQHTCTKVRQLFCFSTLPTRSTISVGRQTLDSTEKRELGNFVVRDYYLEIFGEN